MKKENKKGYLGYLITSIVLFLLLIILAICVKNNVFDKLNNSYHSLIKSLFISEMSEKFFKIATFVGGTKWIVGSIAVLVVFFCLFKKYGRALFCVILLVTSTLINNLIKIIVRIPRPSYMPEGMEKSLSFPSGHTMGSTTFYGLMIYYIWRSNFAKKYKCFFSIILGFIILCVTTSRIYLGAHYLTDIIGGLCCSLGLIFLFIYFDKKYSLIDKLDNINKTKKVSK